MNKQNISLLEKIGFNKDESAIYLTLLHHGPLSPSDIVRETNIYRPTVYKSLDVLIEKGMVSVMPKGKWKVYVAESPNKLEKIFTELEDEFNTEIHSLYDAYNSHGKKPLVKYAEGDSAIKEVYSDVVHSLKKNDVYYRYSTGLTLARKKYVPKDYRTVRDRKNLERLIITDEPSRSTTTRKLGKGMRFIPANSDLFDLNVSQIIYGNKVALIDYNSKTTIVIENEMIAEFQKKIFRLLYERLGR